MNPSLLKPQPDTRLKRLPERGSRDRDVAHAIIDEARIAHVGLTIDGVPYVLPMACARNGDTLLLHGSVASRLMGRLAEGLSCCVTITHLDGLVLARSAFHSSMNYRSLMAFGEARLLAGDEKARAFDALIEHLLPGRSTDLRPMTDKESKATTMLALPLETFTIKTRSGGPSDPKGDIDWPAWAGVVPTQLVSGAPQPAENLASDVETPEYLAALLRGQAE